MKTITIEKGYGMHWQKEGVQEIYGLEEFNTALCSNPWYV